MGESEANKRDREGVSGYLVVALLLAAFGYGVYHVYDADSSPPPFRMGPIEENLERLYTAAQVFFVEMPPAFATYGDLVGPDKAIPELESLYGERYDEIVIDRGALEVGVLLPNGPSIGYNATLAERDRLREQAQDPESRKRLLQRLAGRPGGTDPEQSGP